MVLGVGCLDLVGLGFDLCFVWVGWVFDLFVVLFCWLLLEFYFVSRLGFGGGFGFVIWVLWVCGLISC